MRGGDLQEDGSHSSYLWVLDPIDGTKSFITGSGCTQLFSFPITAHNAAHMHAYQTYRLSVRTELQ